MVPVISEKESSALSVVLIVCLLSKKIRELASLASVPQRRDNIPQKRRLKTPLARGNGTWQNAER